MIRFLILVVLGCLFVVPIKVDADPRFDLGQIGNAESDSHEEQNLSGEESAQNHSRKWFCWNPVGSVLRALQCFADEDPECVANSYSEGFVVVHNGEETAIDTSDTEFWTQAFLLFDISMNISHLKRVGWNQVSIRYIETLTFFDGDSYNQHEHALATIAPDCTIQLWDQYGDNQEQQAVAEKFASIVPPE